MSFPKYSNYEDTKASGVNKKPEHWRAVRLRFAANLNPSKQEAKELGEQEAVSFLPMEAIGEDGTLHLGQEKQIGECLAGYTYFRDGDVCIAKITPCFENGKGAILRGLKGGIGFGTTELIIARADKGVVTPHFLDYLFRSQFFRMLGESEMYGAGGQKRVPDSFVRDFTALIPPKEEQHSISNFLDRETTKIDVLIAEQERLIELLQEKRQAVISNAVTKGLNPDVPMKDSGVEWLGEVPENWRVLPVWILFRLGRGRVISHEDIQKDPGDYPIYSSQTENNGEMGKIGTFDFDGDYLTWTTDGANAGTVFKRQGKFNCTNVCGTLKAKYTEQINLDFALLALRLATSSYVRMDINPKLMNNVMASIRIPVPSINEQESIVHFLSNELSGFEPLEATIDEQVLLLKERRSALISAAVTGQIDVRGLVPQEETA